MKTLARGMACAALGWMACGTAPAETLAGRLAPAPVGGGFRMDSHWVWCGSVARGEDGRWHMFASRWPKRLPFFEGYVFASEVVRASADRPEGPYRFEEVVLPVRGAPFWDGRMTHNPTIHKSGGTWLLYYIGSTFPGGRRRRRSSGRGRGRRASATTTSASGWRRHPRCADRGPDATGPCWDRGPGNGTGGS